MFKSKQTNTYTYSIDEQNCSYYYVCNIEATARTKTASDSE